jgi:hypothetical protein
MMHKMTTIFIRCSVAAMVLTQGCGSSKTTQPTVATAGPSGRTFSGDIKYYDGAPSLSSDGLKLAFESGRDNGTLRVFKVTVPSDPTPGDATTGAPERLTTSSDLTSETSPAVSPDGANVGFIGNTADGSRGIYVTPWAGGTASKFSGDGEFAFSHGFSPDSALVAYAARANGATVVVVVDATNTTSRANLPTGTRNITGIRWLRAGAGYKLATVSLVESSGQSITRVEAWPFNNLAGVAAAAASNVTDKSVMASSDDPSRWLADNGTQIVTVKALTPSVDRFVNETGAGALADRKIFARNDLLMIDAGTGAESAIDSPVGSSVAGVSASTNAILLVATEVTRCVAEGLTARVTIMKLSATPAVAGSYERLVVRKTSSGLTFEVISDPCDVTMTGEGVMIDLLPGDAIISPAATTSSLTAAYVSVMTGDPEVIVIRRGSGTTKAWGASNNKI